MKKINTVYDYLSEFKMKEEVFITRKAIQLLIPVLYFLISISFYLKTYDSAQVKITLLQMGSLTVITLWISLLILEGKKAFMKDDFIFLSPFMAYLVYMIFSFINVPYKEWAIDDFTRYIFYSFISLIVIREFDERAIERLTKFLIAGAWIAILYGVVQWIDSNFFPKINPYEPGFDPFIWRQAFGNRIFSTYGNPNFFANFLVLMLPIIISRFLKTRSPFMVTLAILDIFCIYNTYTKGAWIGFGISFLLFIAIYIYYFTNLNKKVIRWIYISFAIIAVLIIVGVVDYALKTSRTSVPFRIATWLSTWEMIETHPLIGSGVGSFRPLYPAYRRPIIFHLEGKHNTETDHAENEHLEQILDNGILGAGIFYWIIIFVTVTALRAIKFNIQNDKKEKAYEICGYLVAFLAMLIHNFTDVSMRFVSSGIYLGLLPAVIINLSRGHALWEFHYMEEENKIKNKVEEVKRNNFDVLISMIAVVVITWTGIKIVSEFITIHKDFGNFRGGDLFLYYSAFLSLFFLVSYSVYSFMKILFKSFNKYVAILIILIFFPFKYFPVYYFWGWFKADIYHNIAIFFSKNAQWDTALSYYQKVVKNNPTFIMPYYFMGNVFTDRFDMRKQYKEEWGDKNNIPRTDFERAFNMYEKVRSLAPNYVQMHYQVGVLYMKMAEYLKSQNKVEDALKYLDKAMYRFTLYQNLDPVFVQNYFRRAQIWVYKGQFKKAEEEYLNYLRAFRCDKHNVANAQSVYGYDHEGNGIKPPVTWKEVYPQLLDVYYNLGNLYFIMGDYKKAYETYKKAFDKNPNYEPVKKNLEVVKLKLGIK